MDELEFRRRLFENPDDNTPEVLDSVAKHPGQKAFRQDIKKLQSQIDQAVKVPVPDDLANKLILQNALRDYRKQKQRARWYIAMAASVAFIVGVGITSWHQQHVALPEAALAHMYYAQTEQPITGQTVSLNQVNAKLAQFGAHVTDSIGHVQVVNYCHLDTVRSLHLIIDTDMGKMSVFIVPDKGRLDSSQDFEDGSYAGTAFSSHRANILVVGEKGSDIKHMKQQVQKNLLFSA